LRDDSLDKRYLRGELFEPRFRYEAGFQEADDESWNAYKADAFEKQARDSLNALDTFESIKKVVQAIVAWGVIILLFFGFIWFQNRDKKELPEGYISGFGAAWREAYPKGYNKGYDAAYQQAFERGYQEAFDPLTTRCEVRPQEDGSFFLACPEHPSPSIGSVPAPYFDIPASPFDGPE